MPDLLRSVLRETASWDWAEIVMGAASIWVAVVATIALKTWKRQSKAQKQTDFMDDLTKSVNEFITAISASTTVLKYIKISIDSHIHVSSLMHEVKDPVVAYIEKEGVQDSKRLREYLSACDPSLVKIRSLSAKGQVLGFKNYGLCQNTCAMITWQYDRIEAFCYIIGSPSLNWENPEVKKTLDDVTKLDSDAIMKELNTQYVHFLGFVKENYEKVYK